MQQSDTTILRIGRQLRKIPGATPLLDARADWMWWKAERRQRLEREREDTELAADRARDAALLAELAAQGGMRINVGSGPGTLSGWANVDIECFWEGVLYMDVTEPWPLPDASVDAINSEHFIEHIELDDARSYFREAARVLRPGGVIRTSTPSLRATIDAYLGADPELLEKYREMAAGWCDARSHSEMLNNTFYEWGHRHIYDVDAVAELLEGAGFTEIEPASFGQSRHPQLSGIDTHDAGELWWDHVLVLDAVKPGLTR